MAGLTATDRMRGVQLLPLVCRIERITVLENSASFRVPEIGGKHVTSGTRAKCFFPCGSFDLRGVNSSKPRTA